MRFSHGGERIDAHDVVRDAIYYITRCGTRSRAGEDGIPPSSIPARGGRVDLVISEPARGHTLLDVVVAGTTRVDLVARAAIVPHHAASKVRGRKSGTTMGDREDTFIPIAIETYGALLSQIDEFLRDCAWRAFFEHGGSSPSTSVLVTWFRQRVACCGQSVRKLERFMRVWLVLRRLHLRYLHFPLVRFISPGNLMAIAATS